jgi:hypothetical protein
MKSITFDFRVICHALCVILIVAAGAVVKAEKAPIEAVDSYLDEVHGALDELSQSSALASANLKRANAPFQETLDAYEGIISLMRVNSKGKVANEIVRNGRPGRRFRNVARQSWFSHTARLNNYYGYLKRRDGDIELFWCFPIKLSSGRFGGVVVAKIDLEQTLEAAANKASKPFRVLFEDKPFFAHQWDGVEDPATKKLDMRGAEDLAFSIQAPKAVQKVAASGAEAQAAGTAVAAGAGQAEPEKKEAAQPGVVKKKKGGGSVVGIIFVFVGLFVIGFGIAAFIGRNAKKKHEALLREIEESDGSSSTSDDSFQSGETVAIPLGKRSAQAPRPEQAQKKAAPAPEPDKDFSKTQLDETLYSPEAMATQIMAPPPEVKQEIERARAAASQQNRGEDQNPAIQQARREGYDQAMREMEATIARRSEQVRNEVLTQTQKRVGERMRAHSQALSVQIDQISKVIARTGMTHQAKAEALNQITMELARIRDSLIGRGPARKAPPRG